MWPHARLLARTGSWESGHQEGNRNVTIDLTQARLSSFRWPAATEEGRGDLPLGGNKVHLPRLPSLLWLPGFLARKQDEQVSRPGLSSWVSSQLLVLHEVNAR